MRKFYELVRRKTKLLKTLWIISISLGLITFIICIGLYKEHRGFDKGIAAADELCKKLPSNIVLSSSPISTYADFANRYERVIWFLALFLIGKFLEAKSVYKLFGTGAIVLSQITCFSSLALGFYQFRELSLVKSARLQESSLAESFDDVLRNSASLDWICLFIVIALVIIQVIGLIVSNSEEELLIEMKNA